MAATDNLTSWRNDSRQSFGVPQSRIVVPMVRTNAQPGDIPPGYKLSRKFVESNALYQSGPLVATSGTTITAVVALELYIPANNLAGGERIAGRFHISVPPTASTTCVVTPFFRVVDAAGTVLATYNMATMTVLTGATVVNCNQIDAYFDDPADTLRVVTTTVGYGTPNTVVVVGNSLAFNKTAIQRLQMGVTMNNRTQGETVTFSYATLGRAN